MDELRLFFGFYVEAARRFPRGVRAVLLAFMGTVFGTTIPGLFQSGFPMETWAAYASSVFISYPFLFILVPISISIVIFSTAALTLTFQSESKQAFGIVLRKCVRSFPRLISLKLALISAALVCLSVLSLPGIIAFEKDPSLARILSMFGIVLFLIIFVVLIYSETYASLFVITSETSFTSSLKLGYSLFVKRISTSLIFALVSFAAILISSITTTVLLRAASATVPASPLRELLLSAIIVLIQTLFFYLRTSALLSFFSFINTTGKTPYEPETSQNIEKVIQKEVPEIG
jgi:hypothetical protein